MKNNKLIAEINRTREMMGLLNEQALQMDFHIFETCANGLVVAPVQNQQDLMNQQDWQAASVSFYQAMGSPNPGNVFKMDTTSDTTSAYQDPTGTCLKYIGVSTCNSASQGTFSPSLDCSTFFGGAHYDNWSHIIDYGNCSDCLAGNPGIVDCTQYGVDPDPNNPLINNGSFFSPQGYNAYINGNCNPILNQIQNVQNISNVDKKNCRLDYLNDLLIACQQGTTTVSPTFANNMTSHYQQQGCYGNGGTQSNPTTNSVCNKKAQFCGIGNPSAMQQAKCDWLTTFTANNNCNC